MNNCNQTSGCYGTLVPRLHPLTRKNGLVNQVELVVLCDNYNLAVFKTFLYYAHSNNVRIPNRSREASFTDVMEVLSPSFLSLAVRKNGESLVHVSSVM